MDLGQLFTAELARSGIRLATPIILAAMGAVLCNRAGVLNLALEGKMLLGAFVGIVAAFVLGDPYLGVVVAAFVGGLLGALFALLYLRLHANLVILAIAVNLFIAEMTVFVMRVFLSDVGSWSDPSIRQLPDLEIPLISAIPGVGAVISGHNALVYLSWGVVAAAFIVLFRTRFGRHLRAVGENQAAAETAGIKVQRVKVFALVASGSLAAVGGAFLSIGHLTLFTSNISNGRGWTAITAALFGFDHPIGAFLTSLFFGFADAFAVRLQTTTEIPPSLVQFLPHVSTLVALILVGIRAKGREALARRHVRARMERELGRGEAPSPSPS